MNSLLNNLNLSILELVSVLLPGATGLLLAYELTESHIVVDSNSLWSNSTFSGIAIFGATYFLGYIFYAGSSFLDGWYDKIKRNALQMDTPDDEAKTLECIDPDTHKTKNPFYRLLFPHLVDTHNLIVKVVKYKNRDIGVELDGYKHQAINAFQYAFRYLMAKQPLMFSEVERYHSTAKFFRSMTLVFFCGAIGFAIYKDWWGVFYLFSLSLVSLFVFFNRWRKANHVAFKNVIIMEGIKSNN